MSFFSDNVDEVLCKKVQNDFFHDYAHFAAINRKHSNDSNTIIDGKFMFATWAGPTADMFNLFHEIAHFVEIDDARCHIPSWGLKHGKKIIIGGRLYDAGMVTTKAVEREIRTFGIQIVLHNHYGETTYDDMPLAEYGAKLCQHIDGFLYYYPKNQKISYEDKRAYALKVIRDRIEAETLKWSFESIMAEWRRKMPILQKGLTSI